MLRFVILMIILSVAQGKDFCQVAEAEINILLNYDFNKFDQSPDGWRYYANKNCDDLSARLIEQYIELPKTPSEKHGILHFHAGQMRARNGEAEAAISHFRHSLGPEAEAPILDWNSYVRATIGFLERDRAKVEAMRDKLLDQPVLSLEKYPFLPPEWDGKRANLDRVEGFLACWDRSYKESGQPPCTKD